MLDPCAPQSVNIIQGGSKDVVVRLVDSTKTPFDLTSASEIVATLKGANGNKFQKKLTLGGVTVVSALGGKIKISYTPTDTAQLAVGSNLGLEIAVTVGSIVTVVQIPGAVNVLAPLYT